MFSRLKFFHGRPASWSSGQGLCLLIMRSRVRFPVLPWEFFLAVKYSRGDHGSGWLVDLGLRPLLVFHLPAYHHSHHRDNVVAPHGRPNLRKSATLSPQPGGKPRKFIRTCGGIGEKKNLSTGNKTLEHWRKKNLSTGNKTLALSVECA